MYLDIRDYTRHSGHYKKSLSKGPYSLILKHAIINDDGLHLEIIKAFTALEIQEFEALDDSILKRF